MDYVRIARKKSSILKKTGKIGVYFIRCGTTASCGSKMKTYPSQREVNDI